MESSVGYNENGLEVPVDSELCMCKRVFQTDVRKVAYYISLNELTGQPYNPQSFDRGERKFKMVSKNAFDSYLNFLTTLDPSWFSRTTNYVLEGF